MSLSNIGTIESAKSNAQAITDALKAHPEGVIVRCGAKGHSFVVVDSAYDSSVVYDDIRSIGACFTVYDSSGENGGTSYGGINFNESWSCEGRYSSTYVRPDDFSTLSYYEVIEHY